jgi:hypothetical protein
MAQALLDRFGKHTITLHPGGGQIGVDWVPPLGGASVIDPRFVAPPGYAAELAAAGYRPQRVHAHYMWDAYRWMVVVLVMSLVVAVASTR